MGFSFGGGLAALSPVAAIGTLAAGGAQVIGSYMQKRAMDKAINASSEANRNALAQQWEIYNDQKSQNAPFRASALNALFERRRWMENPELSPITRLYMNEGRGALTRNLASKGLLGSGAAVQAQEGQDRNYLATDKAQRLNALTSMGNYNDPVGYGNMMNAVGQAGQNQANALLMAGQNRAQFIGGVADTLGGGIRDWMKIQGMGGLK